MSEAAAARSIARAAACNTNSVRSAMGADGSMCKPHRTTSTAEHPLTGRDAVNITQKASGAMVLKSKFPEVMTILTMIEKAFDLERQALARGDEATVAEAMHCTRCELSYRLQNTLMIACHEHEREPVGSSV